MSEKNRERNLNRDNYLKKKKQKQKQNKEKQTRAISRKNRNEVIRKVKPYLTSYINHFNKPLLFVMNDTKNMECVLLQKIDIGKGRTLLTLPVINEEMIDRYFDNIQNIEATDESLTDFKDQDILDIVKYYYSIKTNTIMRIPEANLIAFRDCEIVGNNNLIPLNVRPYSVNTWYQRENTTMNKVKIFKGNKLKTYFKIENMEEFSNTYITLDTVIQLLMYKGKMGKVKYNELKADIMELSGKISISLYDIFTLDINGTLDRFKDEAKENEELNTKLKMKKKGLYPISEIRNQNIKTIHVSDEGLARCNKNIEPVIEENKKVKQKIFETPDEYRSNIY